MNILFYTSFNERSITLESTAFYFKEKHNVKLLTTVENGAIHKYLIENGIECYSSLGNQIGRKHLNKIIYLKKFIKQHQIDVVHAHLQLPSFYSSIIYLFHKFNLLTVRHNSDVIYLQGNKKEILIEKIINKLSPNIIAISEIVKQQLVNKENVNPKKVIRINNGYDFENLKTLSNKNHSAELQQQFKGKFIVLMPGRFIETKRHKIAVQMIMALRNKIPSIHLIFVGNGPYKAVILEKVKEYGLEEHISILNFTNYIADFYQLANVVIQTSESEASNNVVKEALFFTTPVFACNNVGDFRDYLDNMLLLDKANPLTDLENNLITLHKTPSIFNNAIALSRNKMLASFSIQNVGEKYDEIHRKFH